MSKVEIDKLYQRIEQNKLDYNDNVWPKIKTIMKGVVEMRGGRIWYRRRVPAAAGEQSVGAIGGEARAAHRPPAARLCLLAQTICAAAGHGGGWGSAGAYSGG